MADSPSLDFIVWTEKKLKPEWVFVILALASGLFLVAVNGPLQPTEWA